MGYFIFDDACTQVSFSDNALAVRCAPDSTPVVRRGNSSIGEVDHLVSILELPNYLSLSGYCAVDFFLDIAGVVGQN